MNDNELFSYSNSIHKILIVGLVGIGDFLHFIPTLKTLRAHFSNVEIDLLVFPNGLDNLLQGSSLINNIKIFPFEKYLYREERKYGSIKGIQEFVQIISSIRKTKYDLTVWPFAYTTWRKKVLNFLFNSKINIMHEDNSFWLNSILCRNTYWVPFYPNTHNVKLNQSLLEPLNIKVKEEKIDIPLSIEDITFGKKYLANLSKGRKRLFVGIHPTGKLLWCPYRQWGITKFSNLVDKISQKYDAIILLFGTKGEKKILKDMVNLVKTRCFVVDNCSLREVASIIGSLDLFIGNDSALVHIAASLDIKSISITGPTNFERTGPWGKQAYVIRLDIPCSPCFDIGYAFYCQYRVCLKRLEPEYVFSIVEKIINSREKEKNSFYPVVYSHPVDFQIDEEFPNFFLKRRKWELRHCLPVRSR